MSILIFEFLTKNTLKKRAFYDPTPQKIEKIGVSRDEKLKNRGAVFCEKEALDFAPL